LTNARAKAKIKISALPGKETGSVGKRSGKLIYYRMFFLRFLAQFDIFRLDVCSYHLKVCTFAWKE
jgi:hypothetical protein